MVDIVYVQMYSSQDVFLTRSLAFSRSRWPGISAKRPDASAVEHHTWALLVVPGLKGHQRGD